MSSNDFPQLSHNIITDIEDKIFSLYCKEISVKHLTFTDKCGIIYTNRKSIIHCFLYWNFVSIIHRFAIGNTIFCYLVFDSTPSNHVL